MGRLLQGLVVLLGLASVAGAKPIDIAGELDGQPISGTVERVKQADGTYVVRARLSNGMVGQGTRLGRGLWKITVRPEATGDGAVGLRGKLAGEQGKANSSSEAKPITLLLTKNRSGVRISMQREGEPVGSLRSGTSTSTPTTTPVADTPVADTTDGKPLPRFTDFDQRLGQPAKPGSQPQTPAFDPVADAKIMEQVLDDEVRRMNASGERFNHPIPFLSGLWGNTLYKYQNSGRFMDAPFGALFDRLYNENGRYRNIQECYGQAEKVLEALRKELPNLSGPWELGMASRPGHYWAVARVDLSKVKNPDGTPAGSGYIFVHMDPWANDFEVEEADALDVTWTPRP